MRSNPVLLRPDWKSRLFELKPADPWAFPLVKHPRARAWNCTLANRPSEPTSSSEGHATISNETGYFDANACDPQMDRCGPGGSHHHSSETPT
jgi:hypothetical protein